MANLLRASGYTVAGDTEETDDEFAIFRDGCSPPYYCDLCASDGKRILIVELLGYKGHHSRRGILKDMHRTQSIKELVKDSEVFSFWFWQLTPFNKETEELIKEEMKLK